MNFPVQEKITPTPQNEVTKISTGGIHKINAGWWEMQMDLGAATLPFKFEFNPDNYTITIHNAEEKIVCELVLFKNDSLFFRAPVFDNEFRMKIIHHGKMTGTWHNLSKGKNYVIPCSALYSGKEIIPAQKSDLSDKWEVTFSPGTENNYKSIGLFSALPNENGSTSFTGTFLTESGDYRFLEGKNNHNEFHLASFDGGHAFLFKGKYNNNNDTIKGTFYSGTHWSEPFIAWRNKSFELTNPDSITFLKPGYSSVEFGFPDLNGNLVKFPSEKYKGKVTVIEILGSWCPNCMDQTNFMRDIYNDYHSKGLEVIGLCFERCDDFNKSVAAVSRMKENLNVPYELLVAGVASKSEAGKKLPMLSAIMSYPTTIYIDKNGKIRKIYTGFYGPSTGKYYERFTEQTRSFLEKLLNE